jgi:hypothetical protein
MSYICNFILLMSKYFPEHFVSEHLWFVTDFRLSWRRVFWDVAPCFTEVSEERTVSTIIAMLPDGGFRKHF